MAASGLIGRTVLKRCTSVGFEIFKKIIKYKDITPPQKYIPNRLGPKPKGQLPEIKNTKDNKEKQGVCTNVWDCKNCRTVQASDNIMTTNMKLYEK